MPTEIRRKYLKAVSEMRFDEADNLMGVLLAMYHLYQRQEAQTVNAIDRILRGLLSKPTIKDYRMWLFHHNVVEPPEGFEKPDSWSGRRLLFTVHPERMPREMEAVYASNHVLRKQFDTIHEKGIATYDAEGNLRINAHRILEQARNTVGEAKFLDALMNIIRPSLPPQHRNVQLDRDFFIKTIDGKIYDTDFEKHRYLFKGLLPPTTNTRANEGFVTFIRRTFKKYLKLIMNFRPFWRRI